MHTDDPTVDEAVSIRSEPSGTKRERCVDRGSRRRFLAAALAALIGCARRSEVSPASNSDFSFEERAATAKELGVKFLLGRQDEDGAWRSDTYGTFKDGAALTPLALGAILTAAPKQQNAIARAARQMAGMLDANGDIAPPSYGFDFALCTAALSVIALHHPSCPEFPTARSAWLRFVQQRQLTEENGWKLEDREFGGWGYSRGVPRKSKAGEIIPPLTESNLSATTMALDALHAAGVPARNAAYAKALTFVRRCQNWNDVQRDPAFDDGGFFFIYDDPVRNKAGVAGNDASGRERFRSYGSATADGLRCLSHCGVPANHVRQLAARAWLMKNFRAGSHPGDYHERREMDRMAVYHYYTASVAKIEPPLVVDATDGQADAKQLIAEDLLGRQRDDGSWLNPVSATRENEAIIATSFALIALA
jgi:hypothetical protein